MVWQRAAPGATPDTRLQPRQQRKPNVPAPTRRAGLPYPISAPPLTPQTQGTMCEASGRASLNTAQLAYGVAYELTTYSLATVRGGAGTRCRCRATDDTPHCRVTSSGGAMVW